LVIPPIQIQHPLNGTGSMFAKSLGIGGCGRELTLSSGMAAPSTTDGYTIRGMGSSKDLDMQLLRPMETRKRTPT
jgi:hypothetical protein